MKLYEIISKIKLLAEVFIPKAICADERMLENFDVNNIGISQAATFGVIGKCIKESINFLIVCEPIFYNPTDIIIPNEIAKKKKRLITNNNIIIARLGNFNYDENFNEFKY